MTKLIKPVMIDNIIRSGVVLKSRKAYKEISKLELTNLCAVRAHDNRSSCAYYKPCADISMCKLCFLNANNYLNVLKYITNSQQDVFKPIQSYLYYNSNAAIDSGKPVNAEPTTCSISIIVVCGTIIVSTI